MAGSIDWETSTNAGSWDLRVVPEKLTLKGSLTRLDQAAWIGTCIAVREACGFWVVVQEI
jgi:hypothetical protein